MARASAAPRSDRIGGAVASLASFSQGWVKWRKQGSMRATSMPQVSIAHETRWAGRRFRNCEEKVQLKRLGRMPEGRRTGGLTQELWAPGLTACAEPFQET